MTQTFRPLDLVDVIVDFSACEARATIDADLYIPLSRGQRALVEEAAKAAAVAEVYAGEVDGLTTAVVSFGDLDDRWWALEPSRKRIRMRPRMDGCWAWLE
mgnify:CR=1 FL=1